MALGNNNSAGLGDDFKKLYELQVEPVFREIFKPIPRPKIQPIWVVPNGATSYNGSPRGPQCEYCLAWLAELSKARTAQQYLLDSVQAKRQVLVDTLMRELQACVDAYKDSSFPITIGFSWCQKQAKDRFDAAMAELSNANALSLERARRRVSQAEEASLFWCNTTGWPIGGQPQPGQWFYPTPPAPPNVPGGSGIGLE